MTKRYWSPEQIAGRLQKLRGHTVVCHETIYQYIYNQRSDLKEYLRCKTKYRRRYGSNQRKRAREEEKNKRRIDKRPKIVEKRTRVGDWEGDTIVGRERTERILTHVERKTGFLVADRVQATAASVREAAVEHLSRCTVHTITYDNGPEFAEHELIERGLEATVYFSFPYHSWERGTNENANGLLRQFLPKKTAFSSVSQADLDRICDLLNNRPRKRLCYLTPSEALRKERCVGN
jgi:IS30 family transposase